MFCSNCGFQLSDDAQFCGSCGTPVLNSKPQKSSKNSMRSGRNNSLHKTAKCRIKLFIPFVCIFIASIVVTGIFFFSNRKETVYLISKSVTSDEYATYTTSFKYDDLGRITDYKYKIEYTKEKQPSVSQIISYIYDDDGLLNSAEFKYNNESYVVEYTYNNRVLTGFEIVDSDLLDGRELEIECNNNGKIESVELSVNNETMEAWEFRYYDEGPVKESKYIYDPYYLNLERTTRFDRDGNTIEYISSFQGELTSHLVYEYNERGYLIKQESYTEDPNGEHQLVSSIEYIPVVDNNRMSELVMLVKELDGNNQLAEAKLIYTCDWDDMECIATCDDVRGDISILDELGYSYMRDRAYYFIFEQNEAGKLINLDIFIEGNITQSSSAKYIEFNASRSYETPKISNPIYLKFLCESIDIFE